MKLFYLLLLITPLAFLNYSCNNAGDNEETEESDTMEMESMEMEEPDHETEMVDYSTETIYINKGLGDINLNEATRDDVILKVGDNYSEEGDTTEAVLVYEEYGITFSFDETDTLKQITFDENFKGETSTGVAINDPVSEVDSAYADMEVLYIPVYPDPNDPEFYYTTPTVGNSYFDIGLENSGNGPIEDVKEKEIKSITIAVR